MTKTATAHDGIAERAAREISDRDRVIRALAEATGLSRQTIADICAAGTSPARKRARPS